MVSTLVLLEQRDTIIQMQLHHESYVQLDTYATEKAPL